MYFRMMKAKRLRNMRTIVIREDTQKKKVFSLVVEPIRSGFSP